MESDSARQILAICHYVYAGILALVGLFVFGVLGLMFGILLPRGDPAAARELAIFAPILTLIALFFGVLLAGNIALHILAGRCIARRKAWTFCVVIAALTLHNLPMGTLLGIFTLLHLIQPSVVAEFRAVKAEEPLATSRPDARSS